MKQYVLTMAIRTACILLAFALQPWGWHTAVLSVGAIVLPYIAVVLANQSNTHAQTGAVSPARALDGAQPVGPSDPAPHVIRLPETPPTTNDERE